MSTTKLAESARAVIDRWDSPAWKDAPHTGEYIHALRQALASYEAAQAEAKPADPGQLAYDIWAAANRPNVGIEGQIEGIQAVLDREVKPAPAIEPVKLWCDTCEGTGKVWEEFQKGCHVGGDHDCPDCDGKGYTLRAAPAAPAVQVVVERERVWVKRGVQSFMLAYEAETDVEREWYAGQLRAALSSFTPDVKAAPAAPAPDRTGMTYYKHNDCKAASADAADCICWTPVAPAPSKELSDAELDAQMPLASVMARDAYTGLEVLGFDIDDMRQAMRAAIAAFKGESK